MRRLFSIGFLGFGAFLSQLANAAECETQYVNTGVFEINDTTAYGGASAVGGAVGGFVGALIAGAASKNEQNDTEREASLKNYMQNRNDYIPIEDLYKINVQFKEKLEHNDSGCATIYIVEKNVITYTGVYSLNRQFFKLLTISDGKVLQSKDAEKTSNLGIRVWPLAPTRRFKADKSGKMVEVTKPLEDTSTYYPKVYAAFQESSLKNLQKVMSDSGKIK